MRGTPFIVSPPGNVRIRRMASRRGLGLRGKFDLRDDDHRFPTPRTYRGGRPRAPVAQRSTPVSGGRWVMRNCEAVPDHLPGNPRQRLAADASRAGIPRRDGHGPAAPAPAAAGRTALPGHTGDAKPVTPEGQATGDHEPPGFANAGRWRLVTAVAGSPKRGARRGQSPTATPRRTGYGPSYAPRASNSGNHCALPASSQPVTAWTHG
jgi:hypothetical protein